MGLFSKDTKKVVKAKATAVAKVKGTSTKKVELKGLPKDMSGRLFDVIRAPWFSEKALIQTEKGIYVFQVPEDVTGHDVALAIQKAYGVKPRKVNMVNLPAKKKRLKSRRGEGSRARRHKAYVYLAKGETIQFA